MQVLVLKTVSEDFLAHGGFKWSKSGKVTCPDWNPEPVCGGGLHGLLWGEGAHELLASSWPAKWLVLEVDSKKIVNLGGKVKFPECNVLYAGERDVAVKLILERNPGAACVYAKKILGDDEEAHVGDYGKAIAGDYGKAIAGDYGKAIAGLKGKAIVGNKGLAIVGEDGVAIAGNDGQATARNSGTAIAGHYGKATAGDGGKAQAGYQGLVSVKDCGKAVAGYMGVAVAGNMSNVMVGENGLAQVGMGGRIEIEYYDGKRYKVLIGYEGENIEAGKFYKVVNGTFVEELCLTSYNI